MCSVASAIGTSSGSTLSRSAAPSASNAVSLSRSAAQTAGPSAIRSFQ